MQRLGRSGRAGALTPTVDTPRFPRRLVGGALAAAFLLLCWLVASTRAWQAQATLGTERLHRLGAVRGAILLHDEALTMSARLAAATGERRWRERYDEHEPALTTALEQAEALLSDDPEGTAAARRTDAANGRLLALELAAFERVAQGDAPGAWRLLTSADYERFKAEYSEGMRHLALLLDRQVEQQRARSDELGRVVTASVVGVLLSLVLSVVVVGRAVWSWRRALEREVVVRGRAEVALAESERRFRSVVQDSPDAVISFDLAGRVAYWNRGAEQLLGWSASEAQGMSVLKLLPVWERGRVRLGLRRLRREDVALDPGVVVAMRARGGRDLPVELTLSTWRSERGEVVVTAIVRNLTGRRRLERAVREAGLETQRRIGRDLHDGPAQVLIGASYRAQALAAEVRAGRAATAEELDGLRELLGRALDWTRTIAHGLAPIGLDADDLPSALTALARDTRAVFGLQCDVEGPRRAFPALDRTVAEHLHGIAREAVANAVKHARATRLALALRVDGARVVVSVSDDGVGVAEEAADGRRGLGLSLMRHRAAAIGGEVTLASRPGGGTIVEASCPLVEVESEPGQPVS